MRLTAPRQPLREETGEMPAPGPGQVLIKVRACGVCRTDLHLVDCELPQCRSPITPGHEVVGTVVSTGARVGVPWLGWTCGACEYCKSGRENLCERARFMEVAARVPLRTQVTTYPLAQANAALDDLRRGRFSGAAVLVP